MEKYQQWQLASRLLYFVIVCRSRREAERAKGAVEQILSRLKVELHPEKTRIVEVKRAGFEFLGFHLRKVRSLRSGKLFPIAWPSQRAMKAVRRRIREETRRRALRFSPAAMVAKLNPIIRGWANYFRVGNATRQLQQLDRYVRERLRRWVDSRLGRIPKDLNGWIAQQGIAYFYRAGICGRRT